MDWPWRGYGQVGKHGGEGPFVNHPYRNLTASLTITSGRNDTLALPGLNVTLWRPWDTVNLRPNGAASPLH